ncbi:PREDICTED: polyubiquitin-like [Tarenaya hassleriana]|uniref:polyubiquitin-like n=1 Tax=Tarenaya hassleriana TaxID=28532 RepID=UPI00053C1F7F|nr:PREDICTED: polyubiquitin-like [Tarenaya hassleriana]
MSGSRSCNSSDDETLEVKLKKSDKIKRIKELIQETEGVGQDLQKILFAGTQLKDEQPLDHYGIHDFSTLQAFIPGPEMSMYVKLPDGKIFVCIARCNDTVKKVKDSIQSWENIQLDGFKLVCNGTILEDEWSLAAANVRRHSLLSLVQCPKDTVSVSVHVPSGEVLRLDVKPLFTITDVKEILGGVTDIPVSKQSLFIEGKNLDNCKTLAFYDVKEETILELTSSFQIYIRQCNRETFTINVTKYSSVRDVIDTVKDPHIFKQHLYHDGIQLEDSRTLVSYKIREHSSLELVPSYQIFVKTFYGGTVTLDINKYDKLQDLKTKIFSKLNLPIDRQVIFFKGKVLEGEGYLVKCRIEKHSSLDLELTVVRQ